MLGGVLVVLGLVMVESQATDTDHVTGHVDQRSFLVGDPRNCPSMQGTHHFEALTGTGWDNLRNLETGKVLDHNYSQCLLSEDQKFLIPDHTFVVPVKRSDVNLYAEYFSHWSEYTDTTSNSINAEVSFSAETFGVSASFSRDFMTLKSHMVNDKSKALRVQLRYHHYTMKAQPDAPLHPSFRNRMVDVAAHIQANNSDMVDYLSDLIVRDFGTHLITSVDAGGVLTRIDTIKESYVKTQSDKMENLKAEASATFYVTVKGGFDFEKGTTNTDSYTSNRTFSSIKTHGGPAFAGDFTVGDWSAQLDNALVAIDRSGDPLHQTITKANFPELPDYTLLSLADNVEKAIERYFMFNTYRGCTDPDKNNFAFGANVDDGNCLPPTTNFTFGGIFQKCILSFYSEEAGDVCKDYNQKNPLTNEFSCHEGYESVLVYSESVRSTGTRPCRKCKKCGYFKVRTCCHSDTCGTASTGQYEVYWCAASKEKKMTSGYLFGGFYSTDPPLLNPLTQSMKCPVHFYPLKFLGIHMFICVSDDHELGFRYSIPFGGFFSCMTGNPLAMQSKRSNKGGWVRICPVGHSQHLLKVQSDCQVNFCVMSGSLESRHKMPIIKRPPFVAKPYSRPNVTDNLLIIKTASNQRMYKTYGATNWAPVLGLSASIGAFPRTDGVLDGTAGGISLGASVAISLSVILLVALVVAGIVLGLQCRKEHSDKMVNGKSPADPTAIDVP